MHIANSMRHTPRTQFFRACAFVWAIYSLIIYSLFASKWISYMTRIPYGSLMTKDEIINSDIPLIFTNATAHYFTNIERLSDDETLKIMKKAHICKKIRRCLEYAAKNRY